MLLPPPACPLCDSGGWSLPRLSALGSPRLSILPASEGPQPCVSRQVHGWAEESFPKTRARFPRHPAITCTGAGLPLLASLAVPPGLGGVRQSRLSVVIRRLLLHVLPQGLVRIRFFGFLANRRRKSRLRLCQKLLRMPVQPSPADTPPPGSSSSLWRCPRCGGPMLLIESFTASQIGSALAEARNHIDSS